MNVGPSFHRRLVSEVRRPCRPYLYCITPRKTLAYGICQSYTTGRRQFHGHDEINMEYPPSEEQTLPRFFQRRYYPVRIGQLFNGRYRILTKLGYGANSTVWLTRDQSTNGYSSIKVFIRDNSDASPVTNELKILRHLATLPSEHELVRLPLDTFEVEGHSCLVMAPQACSLQHLQHCFADRRVPREFMMAVVIRLLGCINWLQLDCGVVHTGTSSRLNPSEELTVDSSIRNHSAEYHDDGYRRHNLPQSRGGRISEP